MITYRSLFTVLLHVSLLSVGGEGQAQETVPDWLVDLRLPNSAAKSIMTPSGWGAAYGTVFVGAGVSERNPYLPNSDGIVALGVGVGDPVLNAGLQMGVTVSDLSELDNYAFSLKVHRYLGRGTAIAVGGESLLTGGEFVDDAGSTFYVVLSHVLQGFPSQRPGIGRLHASVGVGSGRFAEKSERDASEGKGEDATRFFGNVALEVAQDVNVLVEWSGTNLHVGLSKTFLTGHLPVALSLGLADLTGYTGDGVRVIAGGAVALSF